MRKFGLFALGLTTAFVTFMAQPARAGLLLEPYVGYQIGTFKVQSTPNVNFDLSTAAIGARLGLTFPLVFIAADYSTLVGGTLKQDDAAGSKWDASGSQLFAVVGANLPLIRPFIGYGLSNTLEGKLNGNSVKSEGGTTIKAGLGASIIPMVSINLEYIYESWDKYNNNSSISSSANVFMLDLSVPFTF